MISFSPSNDVDYGILTNVLPAFSKVTSVFFDSGHFMGKKSVMDTPLPSGEGQGVDGLVALPEERGAIGEIFQEFLREALQAQVDTQESRSKNRVSFNNIHAFFSFFSTLPFH